MSSSSSSSKLNNNKIPPRQPLSRDELLRLDRQHVWHPYAALPATTDCLPIASAHGVHLHVLPHADNDEDEQQRLIDGMSSWWTAVHGYNHPVLNQAMREQLDDMSHVMFGGLTHAPAVRLATALAQKSPHTPHVFFSDSGSVSIEVAHKMAQQYWFNRGEPQRSHALTIRGGYHGDTWHCMSVSDPTNGMHQLFTHSLRQHYYCPRPEPTFFAEASCTDAHVKCVRDTLERHASTIAAVILEPIVQGAGGMRMYSPAYLRRIRELCDTYNVLLIADEIATGFGRTGTYWACQHAHITPDILCVGKALTGGTMSLAATMTTTHVAETFREGPAGVLMHGPTFMGNPLACAVALASMELLDTYWETAVPRIERQLREELQECRASPFVQDVRVLGAIGVVEMKEPMELRQVQPAIVKEGVWLRPFGKLLYTMPPYIIDKAQLRKVTRAMVNISRRRWS